MQRPRPHDWVTSLTLRTLDRIRQLDDWDQALALSGWLATFLCKNTTGIYRLDELETILIRKWDSELPPAEHTPGAPIFDAELHVATQVNTFGGHSSLMQQLMRMAATPAHALVTHMSDAAVAASRLACPDEHIRVIPTGCHASQRIQMILTQMASYRRIILHIHPNDIETAIAARLVRRLVPEIKIHLLNHADHTFSVGIGAADRILEISRFGWALRARRGTTSSSTFIGIPIAPPPTLANDVQPQQDALLLTGGSDYKFKPAGGMSLPATLRRLLRQERGFRACVVGPSRRDWWWWRLKLRHPHRVQIAPLLPKDRYMQLVRACTIYVDSHPLLGGTAFPEALMRGTRVAGMRGLAWGYSPCEQLLSEGEDAFIEHCLALAKGDPAALAQQNIVREQCIAIHDPSAVRQRVDQSFAQTELIAPPDGAGPDHPTTRMELEWWRQGHAKLPGRSECPLSSEDRWWLLKTVGQLKGWMRVNTWTLLKLTVRNYR